MNPTSEPRRHRWCLAGLVVVMAWLLAIPLHTICHETGHALTTLAIGGDVKKIVICGITVYPKVSGRLQIGWWCGNGWVNIAMPDEPWKTGLLLIMGYGTTTILSYLLLWTTRWVGRVWRVALLVIAINFAWGIFLHTGRSQVWGNDWPESRMGVQGLGLPDWTFFAFLLVHFVLFHGLLVRACLRLRRLGAPVTESAVLAAQSS